MFLVVCRSFGKYAQLFERKNAEFLKRLPQMFEVAENSRDRSKDIPFLKTISEINDACLAKKEEITQLNLLSIGNDEMMNCMIAEERALLVDQLEGLADSLLDAFIPITEFDVLTKCQMEFAPGVGGMEAMMFTSELMAMYKKFAAFKGWNWTLLEGNANEGRAIVAIDGPDCYKQMRIEAGVHRVQRAPVTDRSRIHTSTASVAVLPEPEQAESYVNPDECKIETMRSSGPGGQNVNKRSSAVRLTHTPSGISIKVMEERFQYLNMKIAFRRLAAILLQRKEDEIEKKAISKRRNQIGTKGRSEKIRTYNVKEDRVTDHRLQKSWTGMNEMLNNNPYLLNSIMNAFEKEEKMKSLDEIIESLHEKYNGYTVQYK